MNPALEKENILGTNLENNIRIIMNYFHHTEDLIKREIRFSDKSGVILYIDGLVKKEFLQFSVIEPLIEDQQTDLEYVLRTYETKTTNRISIIGEELLNGYCIVLLENNSKAILANISEDSGRSITEPEDEKIINGPHDGFVESLGTNVLLIRKRIKSQDLKVKYFRIGDITNTKIGLIYIENLANKELLKEVETRINSIDIDTLHSSGTLEELIEDHPYSPFPQMLRTERPDRAVSYLTEGKISLIVDGSPRILVIPINFFTLYQTPDDYNTRWLVGSFYRLLRVCSFFIAISLPAIYIAIVSYHSEVLPIGILYSVRVSLEYVPFIPLVEALLMQIVLELLKEASIRLPTPIAQTIGIVGGLVIGTAVVEANLVSNTMIVIIGFTAVASFVSPINEMGTSVRLMGLPTMIAASLFGFFGIIITLMVILMHLCKLEAFGTPYFYPLAPLNKDGLKDAFIRLPIWKFTKRPTDAKPKKVIQQRLTRAWRRK
ncbi:spore germination protein [Lysinibacillus sp. SGAir0095]|uniref:spore germination protein n=1 Tax=Lysinibacillus sp. SGAir0095 TaxID=2070463 RepID=UPI001F0EB5C9|nr:spore germination protein [Lysinibacillus sp. SGAir0095]